MKTRTIAMMMAMALGLGGLAGTGFSEEGAPPANPMLAQHLKAQAPGAMHEHLKHYAGTFQATHTMWMMPGMPPEVFQGESVNTWSMKGKFLEMGYTATMMGMPFTGRAVMGHDNFNKKYQLTWRDSFNSGISMYEGTASDDGRVVTLMGESTSSWGTFAMKMVYTCNGPDQHTFASYRAPSGTEDWFKNMEIVYKRAKAGGDVATESAPTEAAPSDGAK